MLGRRLVWLLGFGVADIIEAIGRLVFTLMHLLRSVLRRLLFIGAGLAAVAHGLVSKKGQGLELASTRGCAV